MALVWKYAVLFRAPGSEGPKSIEVCAESAEEAITNLRVVLGVGALVAEATPLHPVIDWERGTFNKEEAAEYLRMKRVDDLMADGRLPKCPNGKPAWLRSTLDRVIDPRGYEQERRAA